MALLRFRPHLRRRTLGLSGQLPSYPGDRQLHEPALAVAVLPAHRGPSRAGPARWSVPIVAFLLFAAIALHLIAITNFPAPDELQHVSYAAYLQQSGRLLPRFHEQYTLNQDDFGRWDPRPNYLGHPSPFYLFESLFLNRSLPPAQAVIPLRLASLALLGLGVAVALIAGFRCFEDDAPALLVFCTALALGPEILSVSKQVTNDSLALLGGALAYWGASAPARRGAALAIGVGLLLALWAKASAGLGVGLFVALVIGFTRLPRAKLLLGAAVGGLIGFVPYAFIVARYGTIVPLTAESFGHVRHVADFWTYVPAFLLNLGHDWGFFHRTGWPITSRREWFSIAAFWPVVLCVLLAARYAGRRPYAPDAAVAIAVPLALAMVLLVHFWFAATRLGYSLPAASFRYYLPLWPAMAHNLGYAVMVAPRRRARIAIIVVTAAALGCGWVS